MTLNYVSLEIEFVQARNWVQHSLCDGSELAQLIATKLDQFTSAQLMISPDWGIHDLTNLDDTGRGISIAASNVVVDFALDALIRSGAKTLIVEDDLHRPGDQHFPSRGVMIADRVIQWTHLDTGDIDAAVQLLRTAGSGYPTNAYVSDLAPSHLGLLHKQLNLNHIETLADSVTGIFASVYDAETFVLLL